jgi:hypothetical protein
VFVLSDGRRFSCPGSAFARSTPSAAELGRAKACIALRRLRIPQSSQKVFAAITKARTCLASKGFRVAGGPVFPPDSRGPSGPDGELIVNTAAQAFIAFYTDSAKAKRLQVEIVQNAKRFGGQVERRDAVTIVWVKPPSSTLRNGLEACVFV